MERPCASHAAGRAGGALQQLEAALQQRPAPAPLDAESAEPEIRKNNKDLGRKVRKKLKASGKIVCCERFFATSTAQGTVAPSAQRRSVAAVRRLQLREQRSPGKSQARGLSLEL